MVKLSHNWIAWAKFSGQDINGKSCCEGAGDLFGESVDRGGHAPSEVLTDGQEIGLKGGESGEIQACDYDYTFIVVLSKSLNGFIVLGRRV